MWITGQNLERSRKDKKGNIWQFRVWSDTNGNREFQRIFFWNADKTETGMVEFADDQVLNMKRLKQQIAKLVNDPDYRQRFRASLEFPLERHY